MAGGTQVKSPWGRSPKGDYFNIDATNTLSDEDLARLFGSKQRIVQRNRGTKRNLNDEITAAWLASNSEEGAEQTAGFPDMLESESSVASSDDAVSSDETAGLEEERAWSN